MLLYYAFSALIYTQFCINEHRQALTTYYVVYCRRNKNMCEETRCDVINRQNQGLMIV
jgi:hypothetical protein